MNENERSAGSTKAVCDRQHHRGRPLDSRCGLDQEPASAPKEPQEIKIIPRTENSEGFAAGIRTRTSQLILVRHGRPSSIREWLDPNWKE